MSKYKITDVHQADAFYDERHELVGEIVTFYDLEEWDTSFPEGTAKKVEFQSYA